MTEQTPVAQEEERNLLTIGQLAQATGVAVGTLRMWESRHGFPTAQRLPSGHRRYPQAVAEQVTEVVRRKDAGIRLDVAIADVATGPEIPESSVYAELRQRHPGLVPHRMRKRTLLGLTWALEDECCARAQRPWLFGAFQREGFYRKAERRWRDLARTSRGAWVLADFTSASESVKPIEVTLPDDSPMLREWSLVCFTHDLPAALAAWELPGQEGVPDGDRLFESVWTLEAAAVRDAARACVGLLSGLGYDVSGVVADLSRPWAVSPPELRQATMLFNRVVAYVDRAN